MMARDERGLALLFDALVFLTVLSMISALLLTPSPYTSSDPHQEMVSAFHRVMLSGEMPEGDGSALSRVSLADYLLLLSRDPSLLTPQVIQRVGLAVNGTLGELDGLGERAWWTLTVGEEVLIFGKEQLERSTSIYVHERSFGEGRVTCALSMTA